MNTKRCLVVVGVLGVMVAGESVASPRAQSSAQVNAASAQATTVYGLRWYGSQDFISPQNPGQPVSGPLATGDVYGIGVRYTIQAPVPDTRWDVVVTPPYGNPSTFGQVFTWTPSVLGGDGCLLTYLGGHLTEALCKHASAPDQLSFDVLNYMVGPCLKVGQWHVAMTGPDTGAQLSGDFTLRSGTPGAISARVTEPGPISPWLPAEKLVGSVFPEVPAGQGSLEVSIGDSACPDLPAAGVPIVARLRLVPGSGGHTHLASDLPTANELSKLITIDPGDGAFNAATATVSGVTDNQGKFLVNYTAGVASVDFDWLIESSAGTATARTVIDPQLGLHSMPRSADYSFDGSGSDPQCGDVVACSRHFENHYATDEMIADLTTYADIVASGFGQRLILSFNDMSLPRGGVFDISGNIQPPHSTHRRGVDVDILYVFDLARGYVGLDPSSVFGAAVRKRLSDSSDFVNLQQVPESGNQIHFRRVP